MTGTSDDVTPLRAEVAWFAELMEVQLSANDHKTGWRHLSPQWLLKRVRDEVGELERALARGDEARLVLGEAADVANFAMMLADVVARATLEALEAGRPR